MTAIELKEQLRLAKGAFHRGEIDIDALYAAADAYIEAIKAFKKRTKAKISVPTRGYIIRAV